MVSTLDFESSDPSSNLGRTFILFPSLFSLSVNKLTPWRNGSASDSRSEGCVFESRRGQKYFFPRLFYDNQPFSLEPEPSLTPSFENSKFIPQNKIIFYVLFYRLKKILLKLTEMSLLMISTQWLWEQPISLSLCF